METNESERRNDEINIRKFTPEQTRQLQDKELEILLYFKKFCDDHGLLFYLSGGSAIGAIRHKGFIPWDDDIDCFMPRPDYERFRDLWDKYGDKKRYTYCRSDREHNYHHAGSTIRDNNTTFINKHSVDEDVCQGIALEFVPIDGCPSNLFSRIWQLFNAFVFDLFNFQRLPDNKGRFFRTMARLLYTIVPSKKVRDTIWINAEKQMSKYKWNDCRCVTELIGSVKGMLWIHPKAWFDHVVYREFEGHKMPLMAGYQQYMNRIWGDYMQLPPEDQRVAKHNTVYVSTTEPYTKFKGVYYYVDKSNK